MNRPATTIKSLADEALAALEGTSVGPSRVTVKSNLQAISSIAAAMDARTGKQDPSLVRRLIDRIRGR